MAKGTLVLAGSGEFTQSMLEIDRYIASDIQSPHVAIIPTAAGTEHDWWKWVDMGIAHYKTLGINAFGVRIQTAKDANNPSVIKTLSEANIFYFSGGDPGYVLSVMKHSKAWKYILKRYTDGAVLAGSSAGAMMMGSWILSNIYNVWDRGEKTLNWDRALSLVPYTIWPHFDFAMREFSDKVQRTMDAAPKSAKHEWLGIDEDTAVIWRETEKPRVLGKGIAHWGAF